MKKLLIIASALIFFGSCRKCTTCEVKDSSGNIIMEATETCGTTEDLEDAELFAAQKAQLIGNGTYTCTED